MEALQKKVGAIFFVFVFFAIGFFPKVTHAATLYFSPSSGTATVGVPLTVTAVLNTNNVIANAVDASIVFPTDLLSVSSISKTGSIMALWVTDPTYSNANGTITFTGGTPRPGFNGSALTLATITFIPKIAGTSTISFTGISVLSGDGLASELLSGLGSATFTINPAPPPPPPPPPAPPAAVTPPVIIYVPAPAPPSPPTPPAPPAEPVICPPPSTPASVPQEGAVTNPTLAPTEAPTPTPTPTSTGLASPNPSITTPPPPATEEPATFTGRIQASITNSIFRFLSPKTTAPTVPIKDEQGNIICPGFTAPAGGDGDRMGLLEGLIIPLLAIIFSLLWQHKMYTKIIPPSTGRRSKKL